MVQAEYEAMDTGLLTYKPTRMPLIEKLKTNSYRDYARRNSNFGMVSMPEGHLSFL